MLRLHLAMPTVTRYFLAWNTMLLLNLLRVLRQSPSVIFRGLLDAEVLIFLADEIRNQYLAPLRLNKR